MKQENKKKIVSVFWEAAGLFPDCLGSIHTRKAVTGDRTDKTLPQIMTELLVYVGINPEYNQLIWVAPTAKRHIADELHLSVISLSLSEFKFLCMMCTYGFWQQSFDSDVYQCSNCLCHDGHMFSFLFSFKRCDQSSSWFHLSKDIVFPFREQSLVSVKV